MAPRDLCRGVARSRADRDGDFGWTAWIFADAGSPAREPARKSTALVREPEGVIEISLAGDVRVMVRGRVDPKALQAVLTALRRA